MKSVLEQKLFQEKMERQIVETQTILKEHDQRLSNLEEGLQKATETAETALSSTDTLQTKVGDIATQLQKVREKNMNDARFICGVLTIIVLILFLIIHV